MTDGIRNEPAFPCQRNDDCGDLMMYSGMSLRDYFAAHAMTGILKDNEDTANSAIAAYCYQMADAMLTARG